VTRGWEPLEALSWTSRPLISFRASRAAIEDRFGKPRLVAEDSNGLGPFDAWLVRFECGLEIALWLFYISPDGSGSTIEDRAELGNVEVHANRPEEKHILFHVGIEPIALSHWTPRRSSKSRSLGVSFGKTTTAT
jgi:hypothetical protein